jgi:hypothetical protein
MHHLGFSFLIQTCRIEPEPSGFFVFAVNGADFF